MLLNQLRGKKLDDSLPLDIRATAFQRRVWTYLQINSVRRDRIVQPGGEGNWPAPRYSRRGPRLRHESRRGRNSMPSRGPPRWQHGRISLGNGTQEGVAGDGTAGSLGTCGKRSASVTLKVMELHFTPEQEAQLAQIANQEGTDAERLVKEAALRLLEEDARFRAAVREGVAQADRGELIEQEEMDARLEQMLRS